MPLHELDEFVHLDDPAVVLVHLFHDHLDLLEVVVEPQGFHEVEQFNIIDGLGGCGCTLEWLVSKISKACRNTASCSKVRVFRSFLYPFFYAIIPYYNIDKVHLLVQNEVNRSRYSQYLIQNVNSNTSNLLTVFT